MGETIVKINSRVLNEILKFISPVATDPNTRQHP